MCPCAGAYTPCFGTVPVLHNWYLALPCNIFLVLFSVFAVRMCLGLKYALCRHCTGATYRKAFASTLRAVCPPCVGGTRCLRRRLFTGVMGPRADFCFVLLAPCVGATDSCSFTTTVPACRGYKPFFRHCCIRLLGLLRLRTEFCFGAAAPACRGYWHCFGCGCSSPRYTSPGPCVFHPILIVDNTVSAVVTNYCTRRETYIP